MAEAGHPLLEGLAHPVVEGGAPEVGGDDDTEPREVDPLHRLELGGVERPRHGIAAAAPCHRREQQRGVGHRAGHGALALIEGEGEVAPLRGHDAGTRPVRHDAVEAGGQSEAAARVGALAERHHAGGQRHAGAARGAAACQREVERVARGPEQRVARVAAGAELGRVRLAEHDAPRPADGRHHQRVPIGHVIPEEQRAIGRPHALRLVEVLDADGQPMERRQGVAAHDGGLGGPRLGARAVVARRDHRVDVRVPALDAADAGLDQLDGGQAPGADQPARLDGGEITGLGHGRCSFLKKRGMRARPGRSCGPGAQLA